MGYRPRQLCSPDRGYRSSALDVLLMDVQRLVLICPARELPDEASEEVPDPKSEQSGEHEYPDKALQGNFAKDYSGDYAEVSCDEAWEAAVPMALVSSELTESVESVVAAELANSSGTENETAAEVPHAEVLAAEVPAAKGSSCQGFCCQDSKGNS